MQEGKNSFKSDFCRINMLVVKNSAMIFSLHKKNPCYWSKNCKISVIQIILDPIKNRLLFRPLTTFIYFTTFNDFYNDGYEQPA